MPKAGGGAKKRAKAKAKAKAKARARAPRPPTAAAEAEALWAATPSLAALREGCPVAVREEPGRGRVAVLLEDRPAGAAVLVDVACVLATFGGGGGEEEDEEDEDEEEEVPPCLACGRPCAAPHACAEPALLAKLPGGGEAARLIEELADLEAVGELDRARNWAVALASGADLAPGFATLCVEGLDRCREAAAAMLAEPAWRDAVSGGDDEDEDALRERAALALARLNANSHDLTDRGGSGLFPRAAMLEHSCEANCNVTTRGALLWVNTTRAVRAGERLSIDYLSSEVYAPAGRRRDALRRSHGFVCDCARCTSAPDAARAFACGGGGGGCAGPVRPGGVDGPWACAACGREATAEERAAREEAEARAAGREVPVDRLEELFAGASPPSEAEVHAAVAGGEEPLLAAGHFLAFWKLHDFSRLMLDEGRHGLAERSWEMVLRLAGAVLPRPSDEWRQFLEHLAQIRVGAGRTEAAVEAWRDALDVARVVHGPDTPPTLSIREFVERPPRSASEMAQRYAS